MGFGLAGFKSSIRDVRVFVLGPQRFMKGGGVGRRKEEAIPKFERGKVEPRPPPPLSLSRALFQEGNRRNSQGGGSSRISTEKKNTHTRGQQIGTTPRKQSEGSEEPANQVIG